jgi:DNA-binding winged helix-turn-helix (wHTH) protein/tetratricopeptide (TPR) repeat protein
MDRAVSLGARRIQLAHEPPFNLQHVRVDPTAHEVTWDNITRHVQPQALKVLVALHDRPGEVVTRDELIDRCWDGRFVGDDVINRCVSLLRQVGRESGGIDIQTVPRSGYRLVLESATRDAIDEQTRPGPGSRRRIAIWAGALAGLIIVATTGVLLLEDRNAPVANSVMLSRFDVAGNAPLARTLATGVSSDVANALSAVGVDVVNPGPSGSSKKAAFILGGTVELLGADLHLTTELQDAHDRTILWSTDFSRPTSQMPSMQEQVSANLAAVLHCALDTSQEAGTAPLDQDTTKLYLRACAAEQSVELPSAKIRALLKQVTTRQPNFPEAWARLAFVDVNGAFSVSPPLADAMRKEARSAAQTALRLNPKLGLAYEVLIDLKLFHVPFAKLHHEFGQALAVDPDNPSIVNDDGELLMRMGRPEEAVQLFRKGMTLDPLSPQQAIDLFRGLLDDSRDTEARATLQRALLVWPDDNELRTAHLDYEARLGDPRAALAILVDANVRPQQMSDVTAEAYKRLAEARISGRPAEAAALVRWMKSEALSNRLDYDTAIFAMAGLGKVDAAFDLAFSRPSEVGGQWPDPAFLWDPQTELLRRDPRFMALASKYHVAAFWPSTKMWPSFCSMPGWPYDCRQTLDQAKTYS